MERGGVWAIFDGLLSPVTQTFGLGLFEEPDANSLDEIETFFHERGAPVVHEVSPFASIATMEMLCGRGYKPVELSSVMRMPVSRPGRAAGSSITVRVTGAAEAAVWADVSARGWASDYPELLESIVQFGTLASARQNSICFLAEIDGEPGAAGALSLYDGVALLGGAATVPALRRRGLQAALLTARMHYAAEHRYDLAMMVTGVGTQSQRNAERAGFQIAYTRTKWRLG